MAGLIKKNNIKDFVREIDKENKISSVGSDFSIELQKKIEVMIENAVGRAAANNRKTLLGRDL